MNTDITASPMPMGKHKGQPVSALPTTFLFWWASQDALRLRHQETARAILATLRGRLADPARLERELLPVEFSDGSDLV